MSKHAALTEKYVTEVAGRPMHDQADFVAYRDCFYKDKLQTSGVAYSRHTQRNRITDSRWHSATYYGAIHMLVKDSREKWAARQKVLGAFIYRLGNLRVLSMPSLLWYFERDLFRQRDLMGVPTEIYTVENDAPVYQLSVVKMPGKSRGIKQISPHAISTDRIACHYFTSAESFITDESCPTFDAAWLDFTGIMSNDRMAAIKHFWETRCTWRLAITSLNGRFRPESLARAIEKAGGLSAYTIKCLGGKVVSEHSYSDGQSAMSQVILEKV